MGLSKNFSLLTGGVGNRFHICVNWITQIIDQQQSWGYEEGTWKGPGPRSAGDR